MKTITKLQYNNTHKDYKGTYQGKKSMLYNDNGATVLIIEDLYFKIVNSEKENTNPIK